MNEKKIEKMLRETVVLTSWCFMGNFFLRAGYLDAYGETMKIVLGFINSYGTTKDKEVLRKIDDLIEAAIAKREAKKKKKGVSIDMEADEVTKRWVGELLKDIGRRLQG